MITMINSYNNEFIKNSLLYEFYSYYYSPLLLKRHSLLHNQRIKNLLSLPREYFAKLVLKQII